MAGSLNLGQALAEHLNSVSLLLLGAPVPEADFLGRFAALLVGAEGGTEAGPLLHGASGVVRIVQLLLAGGSVWTLLLPESTAAKLHTDSATSGPDWFG